MTTDQADCHATGHVLGGHRRQCERGAGHDGPHGVLHYGPHALVDGYVSFNPFVPTQPVTFLTERDVNDAFNRGRAEGEQAATKRIAEMIGSFAGDYPEGIWPEPTTKATDAQAAYILRRFARIWAQRILDADVNDSAIPDQSAPPNATRVEHDAPYTHDCREYARACRLEGAHDERRSIVAWLDRREVRVRTKGAANIVARAIERGEHQRGTA